ncbi:glycosyltransferase family 2 protein [Methylocystis sp. H62]|uniref:glycosyltransferase family 2 protein n=1 Tax=Methylocystis sp. H62 TaxID=2785789 RepID=UPI0018C1FC9B|nr:glycosyltransferase family 2 protein [Methylocystis sp. H62]MBG0792634.1 glycosyltransferase family 2 protein [Methylocystis sp. H62]
MKIAAVVIWFNPKEEFVENISTFCKFVDRTIIVDNSTNDNSNLVPARPDIEYIPLNKNIGIAAALNLGCERASQLAVEWVLTMDQDSWFNEEAIRSYLDPSAPHFKERGVAIFSPSIREIAYEGLEGLTECKSAITSGSLVRLAAFLAIGGFNEQLFIDQVDHELCFRLLRMGYRIVRVNRILLNHSLGDPITRKIFGRRVTSWNHSYLRKYYMTRNRLFMRQAYPEIRRGYLKMIIIDAIKVLLVEEEKMKKLRHMFLGWRDFAFGRMGRFNDRS